MVKEDQNILAINVHPNINGQHTKGDINPSFANKIIMNVLDQYQNVTTHNLIETYPDLNIDVQTEQKLLSKHDHILLIGPIYWYALPALAKLWIDNVLLYGWAYGSSGKVLNGKSIQLVLTSGSTMSEYSANEIGNTINELFVSYQRSFEYCKMKYLAPQFIGGINSVSKKENAQNLMLSIEDFAKSIVTQF